MTRYLILFTSYLLASVSVALAQPDKLLRALLGIENIPAKFTPPQDATCCLITYANFESGEFMGFGPLNWNSYIPDKNDLPDKNYEIEFGILKKDDKWGVIATSSEATFSFHPDAFLSFMEGLQSLIPDPRTIEAQLANTHVNTRWSAADGGPAKARAKDFYVLGYACIGNSHTKDGKPLKGSSDIQEVVKSQKCVTVFLYCPFKTEEERAEFCRRLTPDYWK